MPVCDFTLIFVYDTSLTGNLNTHMLYKAQFYDQANRWARELFTTHGFTGPVYHLATYHERYLESCASGFSYFNPYTYEEFSLNNVNGAPPFTTPVYNSLVYGNTFSGLPPANLNSKDVVVVNFSDETCGPYTTIFSSSVGLACTPTVNAITPTYIANHNWYTAAHGNHVSQGGKSRCLNIKSATWTQFCHQLTHSSIQAWAAYDCNAPVANAPMAGLNAECALTSAWFSSCQSGNGVSFDWLLNNPNPYCVPGGIGGVKDFDVHLSIDYNISKVDFPAIVGGMCAPLNQPNVPPPPSPPSPPPPPFPPSALERCCTNECKLSVKYWQGSTSDHDTFECLAWWPPNDLGVDQTFEGKCGCYPLLFNASIGDYAVVDRFGAPHTVIAPSWQSTDECDSTFVATINALNEVSFTNACPPPPPPPLSENPSGGYSSKHDPPPPPPASNGGFVDQLHQQGVHMYIGDNGDLELQNIRECRVLEGAFESNSCCDGL